MSFQAGIGSLGGTVFFSSETLYPSANYGNQNLKFFLLSSFLGGMKVRNHLIDEFLSGVTNVKPWNIGRNYQNLSAQNLRATPI